MTSLDFVIIGENIHTTRVLMREGRRIGQNKSGEEIVIYRGPKGENKSMEIPEIYRETQSFKDGRVKHFMVAISNGMSSDSRLKEEGEDYIEAEIFRQENNGADFLDLNVDEFSHRINIQKGAMEWLVDLFCAKAHHPPSIDSSSTDILKTGLNRYLANGSPQGKPMVNSASLERLEVLDLVSEYESYVIVTSAGSEGMPENEHERLDNAQLMMEECDKRDISDHQIHIDPLLFPIAVDQNYGNHFLDTVGLMRSKFGGDVRISGGLSNVSFGLPARKLINDTFIRLAIEAGVNSGIVNPVETNIERIMSMDMESEKCKAAKDMLTGKDEYCMTFISKYREGALS